MAAADSWYNLLIARFFLGFAVGAKSSTTPVYAAESAPKNIRGALTMMWQMCKFGVFSCTFGHLLTFCIRDRFRHHAWFRSLSCLSEPDISRRELTLEMDAG
jgi:MFS family permease